MRYRNVSKIHPFIVAVFYTLDKIVIFLGLVLVVRILEPKDLGIAELAQVFIGVFVIGKFTVFHHALVYNKETSDEIYNAGFTADFVLSLLFYIGIFISAPFWADFYKTAVLVNLIRVVGLSIILESLLVVPLARLEKNLKFNVIYKFYFFISLFRLSLMVMLALKGFSYWSIIWSHFVSVLFSVFLFNLYEPGKARFNIDIVLFKKLFAYGKYVFIINLSVFILKNISGLFIGKMLGVAMLGFFLVAYKWGFWIMNNIFAPLDRILFPLYAKYREKNDILKKIFLKSLRYSSVFALFISVGLFLIAGEFVHVLLGDKWRAAVTPLKVLCIAGLIEFFGSLSYTYLRAAGFIKIESTRRIVYSILLCALSYPMINAYGLLGASWALLIATTITQSLYTIYIIRKMRLTFREIFKDLYIPLISVTCMMMSMGLMKIFVLNRLCIKGFLELAYLALVEFSVYAALIALFMGKEAALLLRAMSKQSANIDEILTI